MQIYWHPQDRCDLGTVFYHDPTKQKILHEFTSHPNSGYLMFNAHEYHGQQPQLWHDMSRPVPDNVMRLSSYLWLGPYKKY